MLEIGKKAPAFKLPAADGSTMSLKDFKGKKVLLWFFPKASTPGCTAEGCNLRDNYEALSNANVEVIGVSADTPKKQSNFVNKYEFPFPMLCDESTEMIQKYGAWGLKKFMGREYDGIHRISYLIDEDGKIEHVWGKVKTKTHGDDVVAYLNN
jgi:peroxiredoxin Q/BCP